MEKLIPGGDGLARIDGKAHFIPGVLPGERVKARVAREKKGWARTIVPEILEPSPDRREPFCPLAGECGGCSWQHIDYDCQLASKTGMCRETLARQGGLDESSMPQIRSMPSPPTGYRARIRPVITSGGGAAFRGAGSNREVPVAVCPVATPSINSFLESPPGGLRPGNEPIVFGTDGGYFLQGRDKEAAVTVKGREFRFPPGAFFQSNIAILDDLIDFALESADGSGTALDLYGGVGLFGAFLADRFSRVVGVDRDERAREPWMRHVGAPGEFFCESLERWVRRRKSGADFVVVDPPRDGLDGSVRNALVAMAPRRISYVSCDPVTQARDLKVFLAAGYRLEDYAVFDLYPQTPHVETVARLVLER